MIAERIMGPWKVAEPVDGGTVAVYPDTGKMEFPIAVKPDIMRVDVWNDIAPLIAAAPELLEALEAELADLNEDIRWAEGSDMARFIARRERLEAAIAKATGQ